MVCGGGIVAALQPVSDKRARRDQTKEARGSVGGEMAEELGWIRCLCIGGRVCHAIPLHAARRAMAAALGFSDNHIDIPSQTDLLGSSMDP